MVWISEEHSKKYPKYTKYILTEVPKVADNPVIWKALIGAAGFSPKETIIHIALRRYAKLTIGSGTPPQIVPTNLSDASGEFDLKNDRILINEEIISRFEVEHTRRNACEYMLATVLHEIVHYLDFHRDGSFQDFDIVGGETVLKAWAKAADTDMGDIFEKAAFGGKVEQWW
jgi:hypothetical protein